jgi:hypothetical protein
MSRHLIEVGVDDIKLKLFIGEKGRESFFKEIKAIEKKGEYKIIVDDDCRDLAQGGHVLNMIFVNDWNRKVLLHELQHFMDYLFEELTIIDEPEAKAIFMSNTIDKVLTIRDLEVLNV